MKMTKRKKEIIEAMKNGARLWRYSTSGYGFLVPPMDSKTEYPKVRRSVIDELEQARFIAEDPKNSFYREAGGSDIVYKLMVLPRYVKRPGEYDPDDPMWVIGCIDSHGAITARHANGAGDVMHSNNESRGTRWRWNIWAQEFVATRNPSHNKLEGDELCAVVDWLEKKGYKIES